MNVFPGDDVGAQKRLGHWLGRSRPMDYASVRRAVNRWWPYAGLVYFHLLLNGLSEAGVLNRDATPADLLLAESDSGTGATLTNVLSRRTPTLPFQLDAAAMATGLA